MPIVDSQFLREPTFDRLDVSSVSPREDLGKLAQGRKSVSACRKASSSPSSRGMSTITLYATSASESLF
jgi:hypothetical protein